MNKSHDSANSTAITFRVGKKSVAKNMKWSTFNNKLDIINIKYMKK